MKPFDGFYALLPVLALAWLQFVPQAAALDSRMPPDSSMEQDEVKRGDRPLESVDSSKTSRDPASVPDKWQYRDEPRVVPSGPSAASGVSGAGVLDSSGNL